MTTYYIEIRERRRSKRKTNFWESDVIEKTETMNGEVVERKKANNTIRKRDFFMGQSL